MSLKEVLDIDRINKLFEFLPDDYKVKAANEFNFTTQNMNYYNPLSRTKNYKGEAIKVIHFLIDLAVENKAALNGKLETPDVDLNYAKKIFVNLPDGYKEKVAKKFGCSESMVRYLSDVDPNKKYRKKALRKIAYMISLCEERIKKIQKINAKLS